MIYSVFLLLAAAAVAVAGQAFRGNQNVAVANPEKKLHQPLYV